MVMIVVQMLFQIMRTTAKNKKRTRRTTTTTTTTMTMMMKMMMMMMMMRSCSCYADRGTGQRPSVINLRDDDSQHDNDGKSTARLRPGLVCRARLTIRGRPIPT